MNKSITVFLLLMLVFYLLIAFVTLHTDFRLWSLETRLMYALFVPPICFMLSYVEKEL